MEDDTRVAVSVIGEIEQRGHGESHRVGDKNELYRCCIVNCDDGVESAGGEVCRLGTLAERHRVLGEY